MNLHRGKLKNTRAKRDDSAISKPITQSVVASHLGISQSLVALALAGSNRVAPATRERIMAAASELGYLPGSNDAARRLIARRFGTRVKSGVVSVLLRDFEGAPLGNLPYFAPIIKGMEAEAATRGLELSLHPWRQEIPRLLRDGLVDGVIDFGSNAERERWGREQHMPAVSLEGAFMRASGSKMETISSLAPDHKRGTLLATQHLLALGHRRIAYVGHTPDFLASYGRLEGYQQALAHHKIRLTKNLVEATLRNPGIKDGHAGAERLLRRKEKFTAVVCYNDTIAMGVVNRLREAGLKVPRDVSVTGFDDVTPEYNFAPALTSVQFDRFELGQRTVSLLCELIEHAANSDDEQLDATLQGWAEPMPVSLVTRASTTALAH